MGMWIRELRDQWRTAVFEATRNLVVAVLGYKYNNFSSLSSRAVAMGSFPLVLDVQDDDELNDGVIELCLLKAELEN